MELKAGTTSQILYVMITDTTGAGKTGLTYATSGLVISYTREGAATVAVTKVTQTPTGAWSSGGFVEMDATNAPGLYRIDIPDAALAAGNKFVIIAGSYGASGSVISQTIQLVGYNPLTVIGLVQAGVQTTVEASGGPITRRRGDSWTISFTGLSDSMTGYTSLWFTVKNQETDTDAKAILQIKKNASGTGDGIIYIRGAAPSNAALGSITIDDVGAGNITIALDESETLGFTPANGLHYDIQMLNGGVITTLTEDTMRISADYTRATA